MSDENGKRSCILMFTLCSDATDRGKNPKSEEIIKLIWDKAASVIVETEDEVNPLLFCETFKNPADIDRFLVTRQIQPACAVGIFDGVFSMGGKCTIFMARNNQRWRARIPSWSPAFWNQMVNPTMSTQRTASIATMFFQRYRQIPTLKPGMSPMGENPKPINHDFKHRVKEHRRYSQHSPFVLDHMGL